MADKARRLPQTCRRVEIISPSYDATDSVELRLPSRLGYRSG